MEEDVLPMHMPDSVPPTMSVVFLHPVFDGLVKRGKSEDQFAAQLGLAEASLYDSSVLLSANSIYSFLAWATARAGDQQFCANTGRLMAQGGWKPLIPLMSSARTVGDFLDKFSALAEEQGGAATYKLEVERPIAIWRLTRPSTARKNARYADAIAVGFFVQILIAATQKKWAPNQIVAVVPDVSLVPRDLLPSLSVMPGHTGLILRFPSRLLDLEMPSVEVQSDGLKLDLPSLPLPTLQKQVQQHIEQRISDPKLGISQIASAMGLSKWKLQSLLHAYQTSVSEIREDIRQRLAIERVAATSDSVGTIAKALGYTNSSNFTRAFRKWTGKSPREIRKLS